ncbi:HAMP domain-containing sensor histidine kinase [Curtobacterium sp. ISL-83]|uniref:sensor histidine kinase n=1 Tax=Curtobacterium sp. ISL-83 TaxID=2819145 RepID=UPI001BEBC0E8|nr:HAMP domain-containing sensor histidine kinase [Curtobacterium sp. ISL-83]MBT2502653.1 HAMP domain-containing histidine kinase [Curtobacterium sp. ISL-83]
MSRGWSIRARTAVAFAAASMASTTAVLVFVNVAAQASIAREFGAEPGRLATSGWAGSGATSGVLTPDPTATPTAGSTVSLVAQVSVLQWQWSAVGVAAAGLLAGVVGWVVSRRMLRPIDRITRTTNRISASNLHERIGTDGPDDELHRLAATIDALLGRLETAFRSQRRFVAQASHELRTPLAVQRAAIQIGLPDDARPEEIRAAREQLLEHNRRTEHLVECLLVLAEAERGLDARRVPLDLPSLGDEVAASFADAARLAGVTIACRAHTAPPGRTVTGEPTLVRQLLLNLVDNAVEYNEPGGFVQVTVDERGFLVENSGQVVPADVAATLTEPFLRHVGDGVRGSATRRHSGLGLSIVAAVARAHGWRLSVGPRTTGGLRVRVDVSPVQPTSND